MKITIACIITALITAGGTFASTSSWSHVTNGIWCKTSGDSIGCVPMSGRGYGVAINRNAVMVMNIRTEHSVFQRYQP
jgi:hypothetical protein